MADLPGNILTALTNIPHAPKLARAYLQPLDLAPGESPPWNQEGGSLLSSKPSGDAIAFQYWPETIQDSRASEWAPKNIPGGSHPLYQWTHGGERRVSFTAIFSTDTAPDELALGQAEIAAGAITRFAGDNDPYTIQGINPLSGIEKGNRDIDLRAAVSWLRWYTYPYYDPENDWKAYEPPKCLLVMPKMGLAHTGSDSIVTVMTQCDVTYEACFENGFPRLIEVALEFAETVQSGQRVQFHGRGDIAQGGFARNIGVYSSVKANEQ